MLRPLAIFCVTALLAGCSSAPHLGLSDSATARAQPYPNLVPIDALLAEAGTGVITPGLTGSLEARAARLRARAAALRAPVIDPGHRRSLLAAVGRHRDG